MLPLLCVNENFSTSFVEPSWDSAEGFRNQFHESHQDQFAESLRVFRAATLWDPRTIRSRGLEINWQQWAEADSDIRRIPSVDDVRVRQLQGEFSVYLLEPQGLQVNIY